MKKNRKSPLKKSWMRSLAAKQNGLCFYCGCTPQAKRGLFPTMDHFIPHSKGGSDEKSNLVFACQGCDSRKGDRMPTAEELEKFNKLKNN